MSAQSIFIVKNLGYSLALDLSQDRPSICLLTTPDGKQFPVRAENKKNQLRLTVLFSETISKLTGAFVKTLFPRKGSVSARDLDEKIEDLKYIFCGLSGFMTRNSDISTPEVITLQWVD